MPVFQNTILKLTLVTSGITQPVAAHSGRAGTTNHTSGNSQYTATAKTSVDYDDPKSVTL